MDTDTTSSPAAPQADPAAILDGATETAEAQEAAAPAELQQDSARRRLIGLESVMDELIVLETRNAAAIAGHGARLSAAHADHAAAIAAIVSAAAALRIAAALERIADAQEETVNMIR